MRLTGVCLVPVLGLAVSGARAQLSREEVLNGADARIEQHRKADGVVRVLDAHGDPVADAQVLIEQTSHEFLFGCNIFGWGQPTAEDSARYRDQFAALLNYATLPFYWWGYEAEEGKPGYEGTEAVAHWCQEHGVATKGHPLVWNYAAPKWLPNDNQRIIQLSDERVKACVSHFRGLVDRWDVVNEATDPWRFDNLLTAAWKEYGRVEYTKHAFEIARQQNPSATLLINDYRHDQAYADLCRELVDDAGKPLYGAIGIQSHMHGGVMSPEEIWQVCERFAQFGVPLHWTETTILSGPRGEKGWLPTTPEGEVAQADAVAMFYTVIFSHPATAGLTWWDFSDRWAWQGAAAGLLREDLSPKPAYDRLMALIKGKWWTKLDTRTGDNGTALFRGFRGAYRMTVRKDGREATAEAVLTKDGPNEVKVELK